MPRRRRGCCASSRPRPASTPSSPPSAQPTGWRSCSTASTSCRCVGTRSAAIPPGCSPACCAASTCSRRRPSRPPRCASGRWRRSVPPPAPASASAPSVRSSSPSSTRATTGSCVRQGASTPATWCSSSASCSRTAPMSPRRSGPASSTCSPTSSRTPALPTGGSWTRSRSTATWSAPAIPSRRPAASAAPARRRWRRFGPPTRTRPRSSSRASLREPETTRFWRCENDRAQAQAVAREIERLLAAGDVRPEAICVLAGSGWREGRLIAAALEERSVPFRFAGDAAFFGRPEVRDALAWLRMLADPSDAAAVVRALTRPPIDLRSVDLAKVTTIARRRKLDMVSALEAALESPQLPPEARDRIQAFLRLYRAASKALERMRADVFVRRLIERVGLRRQRLFAASPETAERLVNLSRLAELAADWSRREPRGSVRDFVRHLGAVADAGELGDDDCDRAAPGRRPASPSPSRSRGSSSTTSTCSGCAAAPSRLARGRTHGSRTSCSTRRCPSPATADRRAAADARPRRDDPGAPRRSSSPGPPAPRRADPRLRGSTGRRSSGSGRRRRSTRRSCSGPAEGLHSTYRMLRDEVLEASWRAGAALSEMRLDTADDVNAAVARYLELVKLAALIQRPGAEPAPEAIAAINELLGRVASPEQRIALEASALDRLRDSARSASAAPAASRSRRGASRRWSSSCRAARAASASRPPTSTSTGPARSSTSSRASSRSRRSRRSTSASGS